jgi:glycosyltransferase involved in cell wall biosynthesis
MTALGRRFSAFAALYGDRFRIQAWQQTGKGKADAVRLGFSHATQPLLVILDADLTMPPEMLGRFYEAYCHGFGDFINGSRLVYPMEGDAMRLLATRTIGLPFELACKDRILTTELVL